MKIEYKAKPVPSDPEGDRLANSIVRKYGLAEEQDYGKFLAKVRRQLDAHRVSVGKYTRLPWPVGYVKKTRNPNAPRGKRWGRWEKGGHAP